MNTLVEQAHAKINLTLEILGKRTDGYHEIASVISTVTLKDTIKLWYSKEIEVILRSADGLQIGKEDNLCYKAAKLLYDITGIKKGVTIEITKRIPVSAGLGGGSADAAATLRGINTIWNLSASNKHLAMVGSRIGSDIPFLVHQGCAVLSGRGEKVTLLNKPKLQSLIIISPLAITNVKDKTQYMFSIMNKSDYSNGLSTRKLVQHIQTSQICKSQLFFNTFLNKMLQESKLFKDIYHELINLGASNVMVTGAGPSMFALAPDHSTSMAWKYNIEKLGNVKVFIERIWHPLDRNDN